MVNNNNIRIFHQENLKETEREGKRREREIKRKERERNKKKGVDVERLVVHLEYG